MLQSWRWFGPTVPVPLDYIRQAAHADGLTKANPGCTGFGRLKGLAAIGGAFTALTLMRRRQN